MKRTLTSMFLCLALLGAVAPITTGCRTTKQSQVYKTLATVEVTVDAAFKSYLDLVVAGKLPTTSVKSIGLDYDLFQATLRAAITAAQGNTNAIAPQAVLDAGAKVINNITVTKGAK